MITFYVVLILVINFKQKERLKYFKMCSTGPGPRSQYSSLLFPPSCQTIPLKRPGALEKLSKRRSKTTPCDSSEEGVGVKVSRSHQHHNNICLTAVFEVSHPPLKPLDKRLLLHLFWPVEAQWLLLQVMITLLAPYLMHCSAMSSAE